MERPELPDVPYLDTLTKALALPALDAVLLATPTPTHAELASQALEAGCHVFVEKPLAVDPRDAIRVLAKAAERDLEVFIGYVYLFHPGFDFLQAFAPPQDIESVRFDWVRPQLTGKFSLRAGQDRPGFGAGLPDVDPARPERDEAADLLIARSRRAPGELIG